MHVGFISDASQCTIHFSFGIQGFISAPISRREGEKKSYLAKIFLKKKNLNLNVAIM